MQIYNICIKFGSGLNDLKIRWMLFFIFKMLLWQRIFLIMSISFLTLYALFFVFYISKYIYYIKLLVWNAEALRKAA